MGRQIDRIRVPTSRQRDVVSSVEVQGHSDLLDHEIKKTGTRSCLPVEGRHRVTGPVSGQLCVGSLEVKTPATSERAVLVVDTVIGIGSGCLREVKSGSFGNKTIDKVILNGDGSTTGHYFSCFLGVGSALADWRSSFCFSKSR